MIDVDAPLNPTEEGIAKCRDFLKRLRTVTIFGARFKVEIDAADVATVTMTLKDKHMKARTVPVVVRIKETSYTDVCNRLSDELTELVRALFLRAVDPSSYIADGSPVQLHEGVRDRDELMI